MLAGPDLLVIMVIALIVFGPKKLPEIGQTIGKAMREFKKATEEAKESFAGGIKELEETNKSDLAEKKCSPDLPGEAPKPLALLGTPLPKAEALSEKTLLSGERT